MESEKIGHKKARLGVLSLVPDAVSEVLKDGVNLQEFRKRGQIINNSHSQAIDAALATIPTYPQTVASAHSTVNPSSVRPSPIITTSNPNANVTLTQWTIKLVPDEDELWIVVLGLIKGSEKIIQSSFIKKRISPHCVMSKGTTYILDGQFDDSIPPYPNFRAATMKKFQTGFPMHWQSIIRTEIAYIEAKENQEEGNGHVNSSNSANEEHALPAKTNKTSRRRKA
ncbi:hypothetical protein NEHOM01_2402 [Nematocida homosporus]|uniref:uncharacterized protein n=1 Tax=Nematocida homosporus TaxID=1912981 RepID=UPI00221FE152|nr:uncharacterized protein NEHOM01_2402 [Nematocida homosporus]KAI5187841.1 hypothetical protein NEHOM01_2402 [Nematocida homosporus]